MVSELYRHIVKKIIPVSKIEIAEITKLYENVYTNYPSSKDAVKAEKCAESLKLGNPVNKFDGNSN